jgi:hypothetical protein
VRPAELGIVVALGVVVAGGVGTALVLRSKRKAPPVGRVSPATFEQAARESIASGEATVPSDDQAFFVTTPAELESATFTGAVTAAAAPRGAPAPASLPPAHRLLPRGAVSLHVVPPNPVHATMVKLTIPTSLPKPAPRRIPPKAKPPAKHLPPRKH